MATVRASVNQVALMVEAVVYTQQLSLTTVLMPSWEATPKLLAAIHQLEQLDYCPLKTNPRLDHSRGRAPYWRVAELVWCAEELQQGKRIKIHGPSANKVKLFRVSVSTHSTVFVATNDKYTSYY